MSVCGFACARSHDAFADACICHQKMCFEEYSTLHVSRAKLKTMCSNTGPRLGYPMLIFPRSWWWSTHLGNCSLQAFWGVGGKSREERESGKKHNAPDGRRWSASPKRRFSRPWEADPRRPVKKATPEAQGTNTHAPTSPPRAILRRKILSAVCAADYPKVKHQRLQSSRESTFARTHSDSPCLLAVKARLPTGDKTGSVAIGEI